VVAGFRRRQERGKPQGHPPSTIDDTPISPFRETTSRSQDENAEGEPGTHAPAPTPNTDPTPPAPKPPRPKKPKPGRGDDAFNPGARLCNPKAKPPVNFIAEVLSYDGDKDRYKCKFIDAKGKKLDQDNIAGTRLHDPKEFRVMSAGQRQADAAVQRRRQQVSHPIVNQTKNAEDRVRQSDRPDRR
jgi:hypothetical protein